MKIVWDRHQTELCPGRARSSRIGFSHSMLMDRDILDSCMPIEICKTMFMNMFMASASFARSMLTFAVMSARQSLIPTLLVSTGADTRKHYHLGLLKAPKPEEN